MAGRPTKYKRSFNDVAYEQALLGATDRQLAAFFKVSRFTIVEWKKEHPEFRERIEEGKHQVDAVVVQSLYKRAMGYTYKETRTQRDKDGKVTTTEVEKPLHPNIAAIMFWLRNRQPEYWSNNPKYVEPKEERPRQIYKIGDTKIEF